MYRKVREDPGSHPTACATYFASREFVLCKYAIRLPGDGQDNLVVSGVVHRLSERIFEKLITFFETIPEGPGGSWEMTRP